MTEELVDNIADDRFSAKCLAGKSARGGGFDGGRYNLQPGYLQASSRKNHVGQSEWSQTTRSSALALVYKVNNQQLELRETHEKENNSKQQAQQRTCTNNEPAGNDTNVDEMENGGCVCVAKQRSHV